MTDDDLRGAVLAALGACTSPITRLTATAICESIGIKRTKRVWWARAKKKLTYSNRAYRRYRLVCRVLQQLKLDGAVKFVGGSGAGWKITDLGRKILTNPTGEP